MGARTLSPQVNGQGQETYKIAPMDQRLPPSGPEIEKRDHESSRANEEVTWLKDAGVSDL